MTEQNKRTVGDEADIDDIKDKFEGKPDPVDFHVNRLPRDVSSEIKDFADENFAGDYGMAITFLWERENVRDEMHSLFSELQQRVEKLEQQLNSLINEAEEDDNDGLDTIG
ncbi:MAG: hypothetical protein SVV03_02405 [Candidatus Nanohaloarchaea archaeon]|nr:hypothetical protein [Candidatus Nanohaloarchaea archaeon]